MASFENRHHEGNVSLSGGVNRSGRKLRGESREVTEDDPPESAARNGERSST